MEQEETISIGKNVIENLTTGMYDDSRFIFREYVQNAADAIDKAVEIGILSQRKEGKIVITIEEQNKRIIFEDNGTGIPKSNVRAMLGNIACSEKDRTKDRGFRGIGRLGGLGYCEKLIFETSFSGEEVKTIMVWNAQELRNKLLDNNVTEDAGEVVKSIISIKREYEKTEEHYFKVTLEGIKDEHEENLLAVEEIKKYLSMVAPIPYQRIFSFREKIYEYAAMMQSPIDEYDIYLKGEQLYKPYQKTLVIHNHPYDEVLDIHLFKMENPQNKDLIAWGWYGISQFSGILHPSNEFRCIRLRKGNIQIGDEQTILKRKIGREERSNNYFIGEIFCVHPELIPNTRQDYFDENSTCRAFEKFLKEWFHGTFYDLYQTASAYRCAHKKKNKAVEEAVEIEGELQKKVQEGFEKEKLSEQLHTARKAAEEADNKIERIEQKQESKKNPGLSKVIDHIKDKFEKELENKKESVLRNQEPPLSLSAEFFEPPKPKRRVDKFSSLLSEEGRTVLDIVFVTIKEMRAPPEDEELIRKIEENLQKTFK